MGKLARSIELLKASWGVLRQDKELLVLPFVSGLASIAVIASFGMPVVMLMLDANPDVDSATGIEYPPAAIALTAVGYIVLTFTGMFFNSALIHAANERMSGGSPDLFTALSGAGRRVVRILTWSMIAATVSVLINQIQQRVGFLGQVFAFLAGTAWAIVTFLVLPIVVIEDIGPVQSVKRSAELLRRSWGEGLAGRLGLNVLGVVAAAALGVVVVASVFVDPVLLYGTLPLAILGMIGVVVFLSAMSTVFQTALYRFAAGHAVPGFSTEMLAHAFTQKEQKQPRTSKQPKFPALSRKSATPSTAATEMAAPPPSIPPPPMPSVPGTYDG